MLFKKFRSVPANTTLGAPDWQKLKLAKGEIVAWIVYTPKKAANLMQFWVDYHKSQILPFSGGERMYAFFEPTVIPESLKIDASPYVLDIYAINTDTKFSHEYLLHAVVMPDKPVKVTGPSFDIKAAWDRLFGGGP